MVFAYVLRRQVGVSYALIHQSEDLKWIQLVAAELCWGKILKTRAVGLWSGNVAWQLVDWVAGSLNCCISLLLFILEMFDFCVFFKHISPACDIYLIIHLFSWVSVYQYVLFSTQHDRNNVKWIWCKWMVYMGLYMIVSAENYASRNAARYIFYN